MVKNLSLRTWKGYFPVISKTEQDHVSYQFKNNFNKLFKQFGANKMYN